MLLGNVVVTMCEQIQEAVAHDLSMYVPRCMVSEISVPDTEGRCEGLAGEGHPDVVRLEGDRGGGTVDTGRPCACHSGDSTEACGIGCNGIS